jgi:hypothetical protein
VKIGPLTDLTEKGFIRLKIRRFIHENRIILDTDTFMLMKKYMPKLESVLTVLSAAVLLGVSTYFGVHSMPKEMGLAILAGALGMAFSNLDKFSEFSGAGFSAKLRNQVQAIVDKETESEELESEVDSNETNKTDLAILISLAKQKYTWRTLSGIAKDSSLTEPEAWNLLVSLIQKKLVRTGNKNKTGEMIWALTQRGRAYVSKKI